MLLHRESSYQCADDNNVEEKSVPCPVLPRAGFPLEENDELVAHVLLNENDRLDQSHSLQSKQQDTIEDGFV